MAIIFNIDEAISLSAFNVLQEPIQMLLENEQEAFEKESLINKVFAMRTLDSFQEEFRTRTQMGNYEPGYDMEPAKLSDFAEGYSKIFRSTTWRNSFVISKQAIEDNQMMSINTDAMGFVKSYGRTREMFAFAMLAGALPGTCTVGKFTFDCKGMDTVDGSLDGTKQNYFSNAHLPPETTGRTATQSNKFHCAVDINEPNAHTKILNIIGYVENQMMNYTDYDGNPTPITPNVIVLPNHFGFRNALLTALKTPYTDVMGGNGVNLQSGKWTVLTSPYLNNQAGFAAADQSFVMIDSRANAENLGAVFIDRVALEVESYYEKSNEANIWKGRARYSAAFCDFRPMAYVHCGKAMADEAVAGDGTKYACLYNTGATTGTFNTDVIPESEVSATPIGVSVIGTVSTKEQA